MKAIDFLEKVSRDLESSSHTIKEKVELRSKVNTIGYFEKTESFIGDEKSQYPKDTKVWGIEIVIDGKVILRSYDVLHKNESETEAEERVALKMLEAICLESIWNRIEKSKDFILYS